MDTLGLVLAAAVHPADVQDRDGARLVLARLERLFGWIRRIWADGAYAGELVSWVGELKRCRKIELEIAKRQGGRLPGPKALDRGEDLRLAEHVQKVLQGLRAANSLVRIHDISRWYSSWPVDSPKTNLFNTLLDSDNLKVCSTVATDLERPSQIRSDNTHGLTHREREVKKLLAEGLVPCEIANELGISVRTVEKHTQHLYAKLRFRWVGLNMLPAASEMHFVPNESIPIAILPEGTRTF